MKEESTPVANSSSQMQYSFWKAKIIGEIQSMTTPVQNADFEQGFEAAKKRAIKVLKDNE